MRVYCDIETDGLDATKIWCCVCKDLDTGSFTVFRDGDAEAARDFFKECTGIVGHNFIAFDMKVLNKLWNTDIKIKQVVDTVVLSRLYNAKLEGGHSLRSWGERLGNYKDHHEDWSKWSQEMEDYCKQDVNVTETLYKKMLVYLRQVPKETIRREHISQYLLEIQKDNGFLMDIKEATKLLSHIQEEYMKLLSELQQDFPPEKRLIKTYTPRYKKDGTMTSQSARITSADNAEPNGDGTYSLYEWVEFDINSPQQIVRRLAPYWHPVIWNKPNQSGQSTPKVCIENIETVDDTAPASVVKIVRCKVCASRATLLESFLKACDDDGRMHGTVTSIGAATHRMSHTNPNTANVPSRGLYGAEIRALFKAREGYRVVGCDASGIQLRALAHYVGDEELIHQILHGDIHVHLAKIYGLLPANENYDETIAEHKKARNTGKTTTYSILMGAGVAKVGQITHKDGKEVMNRLVTGIKGLSKFKNSFRIKASMGYYTALDGRRVWLKNTHLGMSSHLQSFEQAVVKWVMIEAYKKLKKASIDFLQVAVVHDEIQYEVREDQAETLGQIVADTFKEAGEYFHSRCPLAGEYKVGSSWEESH